MATFCYEIDNGQWPEELTMDVNIFYLVYIIKVAMTCLLFDTLIMSHVILFHGSLAEKYVYK